MSVKANLGDIIEVVNALPEHDGDYKVGDRFTVYGIWYSDAGDRGVDVNLPDSYATALYDHEFTVVKSKEANV